nr:phospholipase D-like domain-containing protein [Mycoplana azooxidifex]
MTGFEDAASTRLGRFFGPAAAAHPGLSGFSLLGQAREAFITRLALADLAERSLDMQYYIWDGDTTGRIIVERVMRAADRGVSVRLLVDDPYYKASDQVKAALDAHPNVEIRLFNPTSNRRWSRLDFLVDFRRVNRRMHNKLMVADNRAAIVGGRNIGDDYYGVNTVANFRDLDVLAVGPVVSDLSGVFDRYWNSASTVPIATIVARAMAPPISRQSSPACERRSPPSNTPIRSIRISTRWRPGAPSCATVSCGRQAGSSPTTPKQSPAARQPTT